MTMCAGARGPRRQNNVRACPQQVKRGLCPGGWCVWTRAREPCSASLVATPVRSAASPPRRLPRSCSASWTPSCPPTRALALLNVQFASAHSGAFTKRRASGPRTWFTKPTCLPAGSRCVWWAPRRPFPCSRPRPRSATLFGGRCGRRALPRTRLGAFPSRQLRATPRPPHISPPNPASQTSTAVWRRSPG